MAIPDRIGREVSMIRVFTQSLGGNTHKQCPAANPSTPPATFGDRRTFRDSPRFVDRFNSKLNEPLS